MLEPAVRGTRNVLKACEKGKVKKVVMVSSVAAVNSNPNWPNDRPKDEDCWSDPELCRTNQVFLFQFHDSSLCSYTSYVRCITKFINILDNKLCPNVYFFFN